MPDENLFRLIERNVRVPDKVLGDIRSLIAACGQGERGILELVARHGAERFDALCRDLLDYTERFTRAEIARLPKGTWNFVDHLDNDGISPEPIRFEVTLTIAADEVTIDFTGTAPQVKGPSTASIPSRCRRRLPACARWSTCRSPTMPAISARSR